MRIKELPVLSIQQAAQGPGRAVQEQALVVVWGQLGCGAAAGTAAAAAAASAAGQRLEAARQQGEQRADLAHLLIVHDRAQLQPGSGSKGGV